MKNKMAKKKVKGISRQSSQKKYRQETFFSRCPDEEASQEIQSYHIE